MVECLDEATQELKEMQEAGVFWAREVDLDDEYARLVTTDPAIAEKYGFEEMDWGDEDDDLPAAAQEQPDTARLSIFRGD